MPTRLTVFEAYQIAMPYEFTRDGSVAVHTEADLTEPGATPAREVGGNANITIQYRLIDVSGTVMVRAEGSLDGLNWFNLAADDSDSSHTADGTYAMFATNRLIEWVRFRLVSGSLSACRPIVRIVADA
jgi:hypothetical protein